MGRFPIGIWEGMLFLACKKEDMAGISFTPLKRQQQKHE
jgi:hypothetical protein